jgi:diguanylate cyclase (GGDEF)-like protein
MREANLTVLTIEDDRDLRRGISAFLKDIGFRVLEAENGHLGLELFEQEQPDLVFTDLKMPGMDGFAVISAIAGRNPDVPVVAISGTGVVNDAVEAIRRGAWEFITKPIDDLNELETIADKVLERAAGRRERRNYLIGLEGLVDMQSRQLSDLTNLDALTGLPAKSRLDEVFQQILLSPDRPGNPALMSIDLDNLTSVNHTYGHDYGDLLLMEAGKRLKSLAKPFSEICRLSGSRFALLTTAHADLSPVAAEIRARFEAPFVVFGQEFFIGVNIGIALFPDDGESFETLFRNADIALSEAKVLGRNRHLFYSAGLSHKLQERMKLETRLRRALERDEFVLHYQPKIDSKTFRIVGMETLLRWHPTGEEAPVPPAAFIPVLEETGMIVPVGEWILHFACSQYMAWRAAGMPALSLAVNVSACQFNSGMFSEMVARVLKKTGMDPSCLCLELTESIVMRDMQQTLATLRTLADMGVRLSLDDFGTGFSSLAYIRKMPLHELKIDRSFVMNLPDDGHAVAITESIIGMAHSLNLTIVAEGVETKEQLDFLAARQCQEIQGFYFSRPLKGEDFLALASRQGSPGVEPHSG